MFLKPGVRAEPSTFGVCRSVFRKGGAHANSQWYKVLALKMIVEGEIKAKVGREGCRAAAFVTFNVSVTGFDPARVIKQS